MISSRLAASLARRNVHYGWVVAGVTFLTMLVTAGAVGAPGVLILPLQQEFGWETSEISSALAIRFLLYGLMGPFAAALMNRYGLRRVTLTALALIATGIFLSLAMTQVWQLVLLWGVVVGLGTGLTAIVLGATVATRWFSQRRGLVVGLLTASAATGQLVFLPLMANLTEQLGWRVALGVGAGMDELRWPKPVRPGDALQLESEVLARRSSKSRRARASPSSGRRHGEAAQVLVSNLLVQRRTSTTVAREAKEVVAPAGGRSRL